jgi:hypothetical protein
MRARERTTNLHRRHAARPARRGIFAAMAMTLRCLAVLVAFFLAACTAESPQPAALAAPVAATPEMTAKLAAADGKDGAVDKCVHRCAGCALGMDGSDKWPLQVGDYAMHFCKQGCLDRYRKDAAGELAALKVD